MITKRKKKEAKKKEKMYYGDDLRYAQRKTLHPSSRGLRY